MMNTYDRTLDIRGLACPVPILRLSEAMEALMAGQTVQVIAPAGTVTDFRAYCAETGDCLVSSREDVDCRIVVIRKA